MPQVKHSVINDYNENFNKPAIIISNHQSHLDLLYLMSLSPKIICLTNDRVWRNPFYGFIIRYADFFPIGEGIEQSLPKLSEAVKDGYSILVFPEGTRSPDCNILKFHQGAFYLAQKLNTDIIPIVLHGVGHIFPKPEFVLRKGKVTVKILERISLQDSIFAEPQKLYSVAKEMCRFYLREYENLASEIETVDYFTDIVRLNFAYKEKAVYKTVKKNMAQNRNFAEAVSQLPIEGEVEIRDNGYGEFALTAALVRKRLKITAIMRDEESLRVAECCAIVPNNLTFTLNTSGNNL